MKLIDGFRLRPLGKEFIVVGEGPSQVDFNKMIALNQSAAYLWSEVSGKEFTVKDLADLLVKEYEINEELALHDSEVIAQKWIEAGIAEN